MARGEYRQPKKPKPPPKNPGALPVDGAGNPLDPKQIETQAALGMTLKQIAAFFGISYTKLWYLRQAYPEIDTAWRRGVSKGIAVVAARLMRNIDEGNVVAQIYYLKVHAGWNENPNFTRPVDMDVDGTVIDAKRSDQEEFRPVVVLPADVTSFEEWESRAKTITVPPPPAEPVNGGAGND